MRGGFWIWILILIRLYGKNYFLFYLIRILLQYSQNGVRADKCCGIGDLKS